MRRRNRTLGLEVVSGFRAGAGGGRGPLPVEHVLASASPDAVTGRVYLLPLPLPGRALLLCVGGREN